jgi:hypothetical protein
MYKSLLYYRNTNIQYNKITKIHCSIVLNEIKDTCIKVYKVADGTSIRRFIRHKYIKDT